MAHDPNCPECRALLALVEERLASPPPREMWLSENTTDNQIWQFLFGDDTVGTINMSAMTRDERMAFDAKIRGK